MLDQQIVSDEYSAEDIESLEPVFECCAIGRQCEWHTGLRRFAYGYNRFYNKTYRLEACLDVQNRNSKEPEVLLTAEGERPLVIERKSIMTPDYARSHGNFHALANHLSSLLGLHFPNCVRSIEIVDSTIGNKGKHEIRDIADQVSDRILNGETSGSSPVPWRLHQEYSEDYLGMRSGIYTIVSSELQTSVPDIEMAIAGYVESLDKEAQKAAQQFERYSHCEKLLLLEFYGEYLSGPYIIKIIEESPVPDVIDQVWLAHKGWVSEDDYETFWLRVR